MTTYAKRSFSGGEVSPYLYARTDTVKYATGLKTCRNFFVLRHGGVQNRPGTIFVCEVKDSTKSIRLLPFVFNTSQTYVLEFGNQYIRFIKNGSQIKETAKTITAATKADPCVVTSASHGYSDGDEVYISGVSGMIELNNRNFKVANSTTNTFSLQTMDGADLDSSSYTAYTSGGTAEKIYEISSPYLEADLLTLEIVQSADVVTIAHPNYKLRELSRTADTNWSLSTVSFTPSISAPTSITNTGPTSGTAGTDYAYVVTSVSSTTFEESVASTVTAASSFIDPDADRDGICQAQTPSGAGNLTINGALTSGGSYAPGGSYGRIITFYSVADFSSRTFTIYGTDQKDNPQAETLTGPTAGIAISTANYFKTVTQVSVSGSGSGDVEVGVGETNFYPNTVSWSAASGAGTYNVYKSSNGVYGLIGVASGTSFEDTGITPDVTATPPVNVDPFGADGSDDCPSTVTYYQQRLTLANTNNKPETIWMSQSGNYKNLTSSNPVQDDDAISFTLVGKQVNSIKHLIGLNTLIALTTDGEWAIKGDDAGIVRPTAINPKQQTYNGSGNLAPIIMDGNALYVQARGSIVRDLGYDLQADGYRGNDLTIFASHLFDGYTLKDWTYAKTPHSVVWAVRDDGTLLGLTYVREHQVWGWHRHDFQSETVENVCSVPEGDEDGLYLTIKRTVNGNSVRYIERFASRLPSSVEDYIFMDSSLSYDGRNTSSSHTMTLSGGTDWTYDETLTLTSSASFFTSGDIGNAIHLTGSDGTLIRASITVYTSGTVVSVKPDKTVPSVMRSVAISDWSRAVDQVTGLWHLEGKEVSVYADAFVAANPNNPDYDTVTVSNGTITLDQPYAVIYVGLPFVSDIKTLNIDAPDASTIVDKNKLITGLSIFVDESRGIFAGPSQPSSTASTLIDGLREVKARDTEGYDDPIALDTGVLEVQLVGEWNRDGSIFIRQIDPLPLSILAVAPAGVFPFSRGGG